MEEISKKDQQRYLIDSLIQIGLDKDKEKELSINDMSTIKIVYEQGEKEEDIPIKDVTDYILSIINEKDKNISSISVTDKKKGIKILSIYVND
jgi:hypothetical protein